MNATRQRQVILTLAARHRVTVKITDAVSGFHGPAASADGRTLTLPTTVIDARIEAHEIAHAADPDSVDGWETSSETFRAVERDAARRVGGQALLARVLSYHLHEIEESAEEHANHNRPRSAARVEKVALGVRRHLRFVQKRITRLTSTA